MKTSNIHIAPVSRVIAFGRFFSSALLAYSLVIFLISLGDAIMSYMAPAFINKHVSSEAVMGIIIATSSLFAIIFDAVLTRAFKEKSYLFYLFWALVFAVAFPLSYLLLPPVVFVFIISMVIWGVYYELIQYSNYHFIHSFMRVKEHAKSWGIISAFKSAAYLTGPLLAEGLIDRSSSAPFWGAITASSVAIFGFLIFYFSFHKEKQNGSNIHPSTGTIHGYKTLYLLMKKVWPLWLFMFSIILVDATFWSAGIVISEKLRLQNPLGGLLLPLYSLPSLFMGFLIAKITPPSGKKRFAFIAGILNGFFLIIAGLMPSIHLFLILIFLSSIFGAIALPEILAVFEDYIARIGQYANDVIAINRSSCNLAYIIGPVFATYLSNLLGGQFIFSIAGSCLLLSSVIAILIVPRKIRLPQKELNHFQ